MRNVFTTLGLAVALLLVADAASLTRVPNLARQVEAGVTQYEAPKIGAAKDDTIEQGLAAIREFEPTLAITTYAHRVRARGHVLAEVNGVRQWIEPKTFPSCTAVSLGGGRFVTAGHLLGGLGGKVEVDVEVDGQWVNNAAQARVDGQDILFLQIDKDVPGVAVRSPAFFEDVTLYGLASKDPQTGLFAGDRHLALTPDEPGITFGDSGGGVFGNDGKLIGIIQGFGKDGPRSVYMVGLEDVPAPKVAEAPPPVAKSPPIARSCPNGQCQRPQGPAAPPRTHPRMRLFR